MWQAYKGRVNTDPSNGAQWKCSVFDSTNVNLKRLEHLWNEEIKRTSTATAQPQRPPSLFRTVLRFMRFRLALACLVFLFCIVFGFIGPTCLVRGLIAFTEKPTRYEADGTIDYSLGFYFAFSILVVEMMRVLAYGATWAISYRTAIRTRGAVLALLYKKLLNAKSLRGKSPAQVVNMFANDGQRIFDAVTFAPLVLVGPFVLIGGLIYLLRVIGPLSLLGVAVFFVFDIIQAGLGFALVKCRNLAIAQTEKRMGLIGEIIRNIKCIKLNCWENLFYQRVCDVRRREKRNLRIAGYTQSLMIAAGSIVPSVATIVMVLAIVLSGTDLKASDAFSAITVFFVMLFGVRMIPYGMRYLSEAIQSLSKISTLLIYEPFEEEYPAPRANNLAIKMRNCSFTWDTEAREGEIKKEASGKQLKANGTLASASKEISNTDEKTALNCTKTEERLSLRLRADDDETIENGNGSGTGKREEFSLQNLNLDIEKGELLGICGVIGSGKSALLNAITGHLIGQQGNLCVAGTLSLCPQQPAILNTTVRENILFGQPMNSQRYYRAICCAQLTKDLEQLPENERSKISSCKLSGGQRSRISIARALYSNRDIYLFDDIFSSLDRPVAGKVFDTGIKEMLATKTRLLVTSDSEWLAQCSRVLFMDRGQLVAMGSHEELLNSSELYRAFFSSSISMAGLQSPTPATHSQNQQGNIISAESVSSPTHQQQSTENERLHFPSSTGSNEADGETSEEKEETLGLKPIGRDVYMEYIRAGGGKLICAIVFLAFLLNVGSNIFATFWLSKWMREVHGDATGQLNGGNQQQSANESVPATGSTGNGVGRSLADPESGLNFYATVYICNLLLLFLSGLFKAMVFVKLTLSAATQLHNRMLKRILFAVTSFFHQTPTGQILNRFSKDMDEIDVKLPFSAEALLQGMITCIGFLLVIVWVFPLFLVPCFPLFLLFLLFFVCFRAGIRSLKRIENITRSPVYEHISSSLDSITTIHAFSQTQKFADKLKDLLDENSGALFLYHSAMRWQAVWLDLLVVGVTFVVSLFIVLLTGHISPSEAGMAIAFALQMSGIFQFAVRSQTELEAKLTAVERVSHYYKTIEVEPEIANPEDLPAEWPSTGTLQFDDVCLRYHSGTEPALNHVSFIVENGEKLGIIGRTGSGKTSLCNALFRLYPLEAGNIQLDHRDISTLNIHRLRRSMAVISQEAALFSGTLSFNIDPEKSGAGEDEKIRECLKRLGLGEAFNLFADNFLVEQGGRNLSAGQRQLVCLLRAFLRETKIVVLDEATANVDIQTDVLLQKAVDELFSDRTVLQITHRLKNLGNVHSVMEMEDGKVKSIGRTANAHKLEESTSAIAEEKSPSEDAEEQVEQVQVASENESATATTETKEEESSRAEE